MALARWTVLLMGWVWLGEQGQRLGWSLGSGLVAVAFWWALRLTLQRLQPWPQGPLAATLLGWGAATAAGVGLLAQLAPGPTSFWVLMVVALLWAVWSAALDALAPVSSRCPRPWAGWPPLLAALIAWAALSLPWAQNEGGVAVVLLAAGLLVGFAAPKPRLMPRRMASGLPQTAMGLMMGSLGLGSAWCVSAGWSTTTVMGLHLLLMAALPGLVRLDFIPRQMPPTVARLLPLALVMAGGWLLWMALSPANGLVGMLLLALAWALPDPDGSATHRPLIGAALRWAPLGGPVLLMAVGVLSPTWGPQALALAYGGLAALAGLVVFWVAAERGIPRSIKRALG